MAKHYSIKRFKQEFPNEEACFKRVFTIVHGNKPCPKCGVYDSFYRVKTRKCFQCSNCMHQIYPCANTIFEKSTTKMQYWFFTIWLFTNSKNGLSACELQRHIDVTYKTAWRILKQIRTLLDENNSLLSGIVECDETFVGGKNKNRHKDKKVEHSQGRSFKDKTPVFGMLQRGGKVVAHVVSNTSANSLMPHAFNTIEKDSKVFSDEWGAYAPLSSDYQHKFIYHNRKQYKDGECSTNGIENYWSVLKRTLSGSYIKVSPKYLQLYVNEVAFRYNNRGNKQMFHILLNKLAS